jgi:ADP-ribosylglycohydrolase
MDNRLRSTVLYRKTLGCLLGGLIGDAIGTPAEGKTPEEIEKAHGWLDDFASDGTDDTVMKNLLSDALTRSGGYATYDDWAQVWLDQYTAIFGQKVGKFFQSVLHTAAKLSRQGAVPRMAALGNMPSSSSAMSISPIGIVNACNPGAAAAQAYSVASLIHQHDVGFCQDGAVAMAAAVAEAFSPSATVESIVKAATAHIVPLSGREMLTAIAAVLEVARRTGEYKAFRDAIYRDKDRFFTRITCDSRETVPLTVALFLLAGGDVDKCVTYGANFGRDADTIASMCGAIGGAFRGVEGIRPAWVAKARQVTQRDQEELAESLAGVALAKSERERKAAATFARIA